MIFRIFFKNNVQLYKGPIQEKQSIDIYCGMIKYDTSLNLSHKKFPYIYIDENTIV